MIEKKDITLPVASIIIREYSMLLSLLFFFTQSAQYSLVPIFTLVSCMGIFRMIQCVCIDKRNSISYRILIFCILMISLLLIIYGNFFKEKLVSINRIIVIVGLSITCGSFFVTSIVLFCLRKRLDAKNKSKYILQSYIDVAHILMLYIVILCNL